jgi:hypothetical protein
MRFRKKTKYIRNRLNKGRERATPPGTADYID